MVEALNDLTTCLGRASQVPSHSHHRLDQLNMQAESPPRRLWIPIERDSNWRTTCLQAGENEQDLDILTEIIACARPLAGRAVTDDVRFTLSTLGTEFSRRSRLSHGEAPWVRFLDFTWPAPVVGRSLADLLQHQAPDVADAWRVWSMGHNIALSPHMAGVWEKHAAPRHDIATGAVFVLLSADACRTLRVPPPPAQRHNGQPDPMPRDGQSSEHGAGTLPSADGARARAAAGAKPSAGKSPSPGAAAGGRQAAEPDPQDHVIQRIDDFLSTVTISGGSPGQEWRDDREHRRMDPPGALEGVAPVLDERTIQAIKAYEPGEDTLPDIERLLLSAAR
ncbi:MULTISPECIES: hypothetical protein [Streptomyces]|uniref:hypothetical protein n=1 Tax=Streptomyces TaxID=1883 RepID=UPI001489304A|nr:MULTISPECIES: hypothetical protein [Streptomyces]